MTPFPQIRARAPRSFPIGARSHRRGFTLMELLVALTILALLTALGASLFHLSARAFQRTSRLAADTANTESIQSLLRALLSRARPAPAGDHTGAFDGSPDALLFSAAPPEALEDSGPTAFRIAVATASPEEKSLAIQWYDRGRNDWTTSILLPAIAAARFDYFGAEADGAAPAWHAQWTAHASLPQLIRIQITFASSDPRSWPPLSVAPMITSDIACLHNAGGAC
jgi:general secretion pathway protein J